MRALTIAIFCVAAAVSAAGQTAPETGSSTPKKDTSALVDAAKDAKEKRQKSTSKVITNADVKKSKGKIIQLKEKDLPPVDISAVKGPTTMEKHEAARKARLEAEERFAKAEKSVAELEKELVRIEQSYFEENDPNVRDTTIAARFSDTKAKLEKAKLELEAARVTRDLTRQ